jgi:hypothetical protein
MFTKQGWLIILIIVVFATGDFFFVLNKSVNVDCLFILIQNMLIPFLVTPLLVKHTKFSTQQATRLEWMIIGAVIGAIPTTVTVIASGIDYFFQGGSEKLDVIRNVNIPRTSELLGAELLALLFLWTCLTLFSSFSGLFSSILFSRYPKK